MDRPILWTSRLDQTLEYRTVDKRRRALVGRRTRGDGHPFDDSDPYADIDFDSTWSVPESPEDVKSHPAVVAALRDRTLRVLADAAMDMIEEEHRRVVEVARLADMLQEEVEGGWGVVGGKAGAGGDRVGVGMGPDLDLDPDGDPDADGGDGIGDPRAEAAPGLFEGVPKELLANVTELLLAHLTTSRAFLSRISATRDHILQAHERKKDVARVLCPFPEGGRRDRDREGDREKDREGGGRGGKGGRRL
ncbi:hypothetical protein HDU93_006832 [Gonapodya sp. JEL0774]|nr:hypothetical protein HDU93_006832 [Gonapodya sp. JEL0774]